MQIDFAGLGCIPQERFLRNAELVEALGLPRLLPGCGEGRPLAIVGGGPSVRQHLEELRGWEGEIWAINGVCRWLKGEGVSNPILFSIDPMGALVEAAKGIEDAVLSINCDPSVFDEILRNGGKIRTFKIDGTCPAGATTATCGPSLGFLFGFSEVHFFGCDSVLSEDWNVYRALEPSESDLWMVITVGEESFFTVPEFIMQAELLAKACSTFPTRLKNRSEGLIGPLMESGGKWDAVFVSNEVLRGMKRTLEEAVAERNGN